MKIYLDACALNRLTDDQGQARIRAEAEAVDRIFALINASRLHWTASQVLRAEVLRNPNEEKRRNALRLLTVAEEMLLLTDAVIQRGEVLERVGFGQFDALHLASAEAAQAQVLLTTDDRFLRLAARGVEDSQIEVANPVDWLRRVEPWLR